MISMTDFIMEKENPTYLAEQYTEADVVQTYMEFSAATAALSYLLEYSSIASFCESESIQKPEILQEFDLSELGNNIKNFFVGIWEWMKSLVAAIIRMFTKEKLVKLVAKLKQRDPNEIVPMDADMKALLVGWYISLASITGLGVALRLTTTEIAPNTIAGAIDMEGIATMKTALTSVVNSKGKITPELLKNWAGITALGLPEADQAFEDLEKLNETPVSAVISMLETMIKYDVPTHGNRLLKALNVKPRDLNVYSGENTAEPITKDQIKQVKEVANLIAKVYDMQIRGLTKLIEKFVGNAKPANAEQYKQDVANAKSLKGGKLSDLTTKSTVTEYAVDDYFA